MNAESNIPGPVAPPPGWYPDQAGGLRWWNGVEWTADYRPPMPSGASAQLAPTAQIAEPDPIAEPVPDQVSPGFDPHWGAAPQAPVVVAPKRSRKGLAIGLIAAGAVVVLGGVIGGGLLIGSLVLPVPHGSNVNPGLTDTPEPMPAPDETTSSPKTPAPSDGTKKGAQTGSDVLAERKQFMADQRLPLDGSMLKPVTQAQKDYIAELTKQYSALGLTIGEQDVSIALALSADACETSILNGHEVSEFIVRTHAATSPLIAAITKDTDPTKKAVAVNGLMKTAVLGVNYMCPADHAQWSEAFAGINGSW